MALRDHAVYYMVYDPIEYDACKGFSYDAEYGYAERGYATTPITSTSSPFVFYIKTQDYLHYF